MPALFNASKAMPALIAPSPITATARRDSPSAWPRAPCRRGRDRRRAVRGAEGVVSLSMRRGKPMARLPAATGHPGASTGEDSCARSLVPNPRRDGRRASGNRNAGQSSTRRYPGWTTDGRVWEPRSAGTRAIRAPARGNRSVDSARNAAGESMVSKQSLAIASVPAQHDPVGELVQGGVRALETPRVQRCASRATPRRAGGLDEAEQRDIRRFSLGVVLPAVLPIVVDDPRHQHVIGVWKA